MNKLKFLLFSISIIALMIGIYSCTKDTETFSEKKSDETTVQNRTRMPSGDNMTETVTVLGRQRNNPYTIPNMTLAFNTLYKTNKTALNATHKYVKFLPTTGDHLAILTDWELNTLTPLFDFPLDYEITTHGDYYVDPLVQDSAFTYKYASVAAAVALPNVPHLVISDLFIPPYDSYVTEQAFYQVNEVWEGDTSPHIDGPGDGDDPSDKCTPGCSNYPCCKLGWNDCDEYVCTTVLQVPTGCLEGSPNWPACLGQARPPVNPYDPNSGLAYDYCECSEYFQDQEIKRWKIQVNEYTDCSVYERYWSPGNYVTCETWVPPPPPTFPTNACGCIIPFNPKFPSGCVQVDRDGNPNFPVQKVMIKLKDDYFTSDMTFTNDQGCWTHPEEYSNNVWMWVQFENNNCKVRAMRRGFVWQAAAIADDYVDKFKDRPYNNILVRYSNGQGDNESLARRYWACAHTINADNEYRIAALGDGIPIPRTGLNYLLNAGNSTGGAPMLQGHPYGSWPQLLSSIGMGVLPSYIVYSLMPDITNNYSPIDNAFRYIGTHMHESGHASHHTLVGEGYWIPYRNHIVNNTIAGNGLYGTFGNFAFGSDPGRVALGEAIGDFIGNRYGGTPDGGEFRPFDNPLAENPENYIPRGLMFDLIDNSPWEIVTDPNPPLTPLKTGPDNISGFTPAMIYGALTPNVNSIRNFRDRLRTVSLSATPNNATDFDRFVDVYDVFN